jgi:hypothetical protein
MNRYATRNNVRAAMSSALTSLIAHTPPWAIHRSLPHTSTPRASLPPVDDPRCPWRSNRMRMNNAERATSQLLFTQSSASERAFKASLSRLNPRSGTMQDVCVTFHPMADIDADIGLWYGNAPTPAAGNHARSNHTHTCNRPEEYFSAQAVAQSGDTTR